MDFAATKTQQAERLRQLRAACAARQLDGFFVPVADEYMNEYVPDCAQRLAWLTGFTGSAGLALVLPDRACVFVDGRYTLQAEAQLEAGLYTIIHSGKTSVAAYCKNLPSTTPWRVGYDPCLHTTAWLEKIQGITLVAVSPNLIDGLWQNRPSPPCAPIVAQPLAYAGQTTAEKCRILAAGLQQVGAAVAVITSPPSLAWLLNVRGGDVPNTPLPLSTAILHKTGEVEWFVAPEKTSPALLAQLPEGVHCHPPAAFIPALQRCGQNKLTVQVDKTHSPAYVVAALAGAVLHQAADPCDMPKACKNAVEIAGIKNAHRRDGLALTRFLCWLDGVASSGAVDEVAAEAKLLAYRQQDPAFLYPSFPSISAAGAHGAVVHYRATPASNRPLQQGELYLIDSGGQYADGTTDVTRTVAIGTPTPAMRRHFTLVLQGHIALARARFPHGVSGANLDVLARFPLWQEGLDYDHGTGHGVGAFLGVHEGPQSISLRSTVALQRGMVLSNEPGFYLAGAYGIRIENLVFIKESLLQLDGKPMLEFETLTLAPLDSKLIDVTLLNAAEKAWLNTYHAAVFAAHAESLNPTERAWLAQVTAACL